MEIKIVPASIDCEDARKLIGELNQVLTVITGDDGTANFHSGDVMGERAVFMIAYIDGVPYGCGALRQVSEDTAEVKRVYSRKNQHGIGSAILKALEAKAIEFYNKNGYSHCEAFGKYVGKENAYCFEKVILNDMYASLC